MKKMLFIINPRSGKEQIRSRLLEILDSFVKAGYGPSVYITQGPKDAEYQAARAKTKELVVCSGGDGTLNEVVSGLMTITPEKRPELGYIPSGSTNDFASSLGLPKNMRKAAQTAALGKPFLVDVGVFGKNRYFVYVAAFGLFTGVSYQTPQEDKQVLGRLAYFLHGVKALGEVKPIRARVEFDGQSLELDVLDGLVCSTTSVGGVLALDSLGISLNDGQSELLLVRDIKNLIDFNNVSTALLKSDFRENENIVSKKVRRVKFLFDSPVDWTLDGEYGGTVKEVEIVNHQRAVNIIVPR